nr:MAG TPA: hypothetical protein [Caudoviricetes sp.]
MGEIFWRKMYRESRNATRWLISFAIAEGIVVALLAAALAWAIK